MLRRVQHLKEVALILMSVLFLYKILCYSSFWLALYSEIPFNNLFFFDRDEYIVLHKGDLKGLGRSYKVIFGIFNPLEGEYASSHTEIEGQDSIITHYFGPFPFLVYMERNRYGFWQSKTSTIDYFNEGGLIHFFVSNNLEIGRGIYNTVIIMPPQYNRIVLERLENEKLYDFIVNKIDIYIHQYFNFYIVDIRSPFDFLNSDMGHLLLEIIFHA